MNDHTPTTLLDRLDQTPMPSAPLADLLTAGRAARKRQRRAAVAGTVVAMALVLGGGTVAVQALASGSDRTMSPADGTPAASDLKVRTTYEIPSFANVQVGEPIGSGVRAVWNPDSGTLTYVSDVGYSGSCRPAGTATVNTQGTVRLTIVDNLGRPGFGCTADAVRVAAIIDGVTSAPKSLTVTEGGNTREVPFATDGSVATSHASSPSDWKTIEYGQVTFDVPADWSLSRADTCFGEAIVSPPRVRTSCPPLPSALISRISDGAPATGASTVEVAVGDFVVRLTGVDARTAQVILASVRSR